MAPETGRGRATSAGWFPASFSLSGSPLSPATEVVEESTPQHVVMAAESGESPSLSVFLC